MVKDKLISKIRFRNQSWYLITYTITRIEQYQQVLNKNIVRRGNNLKAPKLH